MDAVSGPLEFEWRGREAYGATWQHQLEVHAARCREEVHDRVIFVEHEPVVTLGRRGDSSHLVAGEELLRQRGIEFHRIERGGDITYHGPGQLVGYPIIGLRQRGMGVREYVACLENLLINCLATFDIRAHTVKGLTGVWIGETKLAAIGVAVRHGVTFHGFALNVNTDLSYYSLIVPCGITGRGVGSMALALGSEVNLMDVKQICAMEFSKVFRAGLANCGITC